MVKVKGALASESAHGSIAGILTYSKKRSGQQGRKYTKPLTIPTPAQRAQRRLTDFLVAQWQNMTPDQKATWETNAKASGLNLSGYHYFLREAHRDLYTHTGLALYLPMNQITGGKVLDLSGQGYNGSLGPSYPSNAPVITTGMNTKMSNCLQFDGVDDYVNVGNQPRLNFGLGDFSICMLLYGETQGGYKRPIGKMGWDNTWQGYIFNYDSQGSSAFIIGDGNSDLSTDYRPTVINKWAHHTFRRVGSTLDWFIDGILVETKGGANLNIDNIQRFTIGIDSWFEKGSKGKIDEVCAYNRSLTNTEINTRYKFATKKI